MTNVRCSIRRHNNPMVWILLLVLIWYSYPAFQADAPVKKEPANVTQP
jgi:hypothetical protein